MSLPFSDPRNWLEIVPRTLQASPLYSALWEHLQTDSELLALMELMEKDQPLPVTFFTAINYLVLGEPQDPLAQFYPYLQPEHTRPAAEAYPFFRSFVLKHRDILREILPTARLQTNEVTRCSNLLPAFLLAYQRGGSQALNMIEIGSSAGFNLLWHHYGYRYRQGDAAEDLFLNDRQAPVQVECELTAERAFPLSASAVLPPVARCQGIELCPRDIHNEADMRWVRGAIWPEEVERHRTFDAALAFARRTPLPLHVGDASELLPNLLAAIPPTQTAVVWHSYAVNQGPLEVKERLHAQMAEASRRIPIYRIALEALPPSPQPCLELYEYRDGRVVSHEMLARCAFHGERMNWLAEQPVL